MRNGAQVLDGSNIMELVGNEQGFSNYVDSKFHQLDKDRDGKLSLKELEPAVADIGAALGLPAQGTTPDSDHIYYQVLFFSSYFFLFHVMSCNVMCLRARPCAAKCVESAF